MRVISGSAKGRKLIAPPDDGTIRPTGDRVKEAIFDIIQFEVEGRRVLDLFAGSGQLGIEALSRGAATVTFVDENSDSIKLVRQNVEKCKDSFADSRYNIHQSESISFLRRVETYDIILLDPPFMTNLMKKSLEMIKIVDKLNIGGIIVCESSQPQEEFGAYTRKVYKYGKTYVTVFKNDEDEILKYVQNDSF